MHSAILPAYSSSLMEVRTGAESGTEAEVSGDCSYWLSLCFMLSCLSSFLLIKFLFTLYPDHSFPSLFSQALAHPSPSAQKKRGLPWTSTCLSRCILFYLGDSPVRGKGSNGRQQSQRHPLLLLLGISHEDPIAKLLHMCRGPRSVPCMLSGWCFSLCKTLWAHVS